ncbi:HK97 family phage portal protein [Novosphingobium kunmingense]|uniref:HK97 family phage portal protein n=1 Tax=Novosphingobium kunmingense TaxID=1211806 RepID=A0A2N0HL65_9SPHN|nr:phage portal protein [Novosphingobium kunmingense]PKB19649.1 HK97 family phage portal protein [Novosphingobium kunmingense]
MSWLDRLFGREVEASALGLPQAYGVLDLKRDIGLGLLSGGYATRSGRAVSERSAMSNATFQRAVTLISSAVGMLPMNLHQKLGDGSIEKADAHPVHRLLRKMPNSAQTPFEFKSYMQGRALLHGDAYAYKVPGVRGPQALWPLDPRRITPVQDTADFRLRFKYQPKTGAEKVYEQAEIFHLRAPWSSDGLTGEGLLKLAAEVLGMADVVDETAAAILRNGTQPGGALTHPKELSDAAVNRLRQQMRDRMQGAENAGRWFVLEEDMKANPFPSNGKDLEQVAQRKFQAEEIGRVSGVPRPLLMFDETAWGSGIEQLGLFFVTYCLMPWFVAWEEAVARDLLSERDRDSHYAKFNEGALLRGSLKDQAEFFAKAIGGPGAGGFMLPDEAREKMDMNPLDGGEGRRPAWKQDTAQGTGDA